MRRPGGSFRPWWGLYGAGVPSATESDGSPVEPRSAMEVRDFRFLWLNTTAFMMLMNAQRFVFAWFVLDGLDRSEADQGLVVFAIGVPAIFLTLHAGVWADRWNRKRLLISTQAVQIATMGLLVVLITTDRATFGWLLVLGFLSGSATTIGGPVRSSLVPAIVPRSVIYGAIALNAIGVTISMVLGPVLARLAGTVFGFEGAFGFMVGLVFVGLLVLVPLRVPPHEHVTESRPVRRDLADLWVWVGESAPVRKLLVLLSMAGVTIMPLGMILMQAHVKDGLGRDSGDAAFPLATMGVGLAITSLVVMRKGDLANKGGWFMGALVIGGSSVCAMGQTTALWQMVALGLSMGLGGGLYMTMSQGLLQTHTPQPLMGRMMAVFALVQAGVTPLSALIYGYVAESVGTGATMSVGGAACAVIAVVSLATDRSGLRSLG